MTRPFATRLDVRQLGVRPATRQLDIGQLDIGLPVVALMLLGAGLLILSSAAPQGGFLTQQIIYLVLGLLAAGIILRLGRKRVMQLAFPAYATTILLLVLTHFFGLELNGARHWLKLGPLPPFQPSELSKLALILALAVALQHHRITNVLHYLKPLLLIAIPLMLVHEEPDLGGSLVIAATGAGVLLACGIPRRHLLLVLLLVGVGVPTVLLPNLRPHQRVRVQSFLNPAADPLGSGYQVIQARIAVGSGGVMGKGYKQGTQSQLGFIPYTYTDMIFPVLAEEGGFVGAVGLLLLFAMLFWRLIVMATECPSERDQLAIAGIFSLFGFQVFVNVGVSLGLAPVTGVTLPLVSYGGTSLLSSIAALALALVIHRDRYADW